MVMLEELEFDAMILSGLPKTERKFTKIEMEGKDFNVRTFYTGSADDGKKTLVFTHGFIGPTVMYFYAMAQLAQKYRIVMFDNCCKGMNTRLETTNATDSHESAQQWLLEFITKTIDALDDLPNKFYLAGHSMGGFYAALYAS